MESFLWDVAKLFIGVGLGAAGFVAGRLYERWKPIHFRVSRWDVSYKKTGPGFRTTVRAAEANDAIVGFHLIWFNTKTEAIGLHGVGLQFRDHHRKTLFTLDVLDSPDGRVRNVDLPSHQTVETVGWGILGPDKFSLLPTVQYIWFVAQSTEGKGTIREWLIATYEHPRAQ